MTRVLCVLFVVAATFSLAASKMIVIKEGEYELEWTLDDENINVTASVKTLGYVGFGISSFGSMMDADVILSGRYNNGSAYVQDSYGFANAAPLADTVQDVTMISATENTTHTIVTFTRKLDTGDAEQDKPVLNETQFIIWSYGPTDNFQYHGPNRGMVELNLMEP